LLAEKTIEDTLLHFGQTQEAARRRYREFVEKALPKADAPSSKAVVLSGALAATKQGFWVGQKKREKKAMQGSWGVGIL